MRSLLLFSTLSAFVLAGCIRDDIVFDATEPELRITTCLDSLVKDSVYQLEAMYLNYVGIKEDVPLQWKSSDPSILSVNSNGMISSHEYGAATIMAMYTSEAGTVSDAMTINVGRSTYCAPQERLGTIITTSSYQLEGEFTLKKKSYGVLLKISDNYKASTSLPGLYVYLSNNNATTVGAYEIGAVEVFSGAHSYMIPDVGVDDYKYVLYFCKPFNVKVGHGEIQ